MAGSDMMANLFGADSDEEEEEYEGSRPMDEDAEGHQGEEDDEEEYARERNSDEEENDKDAGARSDGEGENDKEEEEEDQEPRYADSDAAGDQPQELRDEIEDDEDGGEEYGGSQRRVKERPVGPPIELDIPMQPPPGQSEQMNVVKVSNIMGIEMRPFDPDTYEAQDMYIKDESGKTQRVKLDENVVRWRYAKDDQGNSEMESNSRFVKWSDGSMQLFIGSEVLNIAVQQTKGDQSHLFLRHKGGVLQSQGRLFNKMKFMPSSLTSKSHKLLTALVDTKHKKVFKVKKVVTTVDPDKQKEEHEKEVEKRIRSKEELQKKQDREMRKYAPQERRLPAPNYLEEEEEQGGGRRRPMVDEDEEREAESRILKAKRDTPMSRERERSLRGSHGMRASMNARLEESEDEAEEGEASEPESEAEPDDAEDLSDAEAEEEEAEAEEEEEAAAPEEAEAEEEEARSTDSERDARARGHGRDNYGSKGKGTIKRKRVEEEERRPVSRRRVVSDDESD